MKYGLKVEAPQIAGQERIFTPEALEFILELENNFGFPRRGADGGACQASGGAG